MDSQSLKAHPRRNMSLSFFFFLFLVDLANTFFGLILSVITMLYGSEDEGTGIGLGVLLFTTIIQASR
jgi:hypothetical protein